MFNTNQTLHYLTATTTMIGMGQGTASSHFFQVLHWQYIFWRLPYFFIIKIVAIFSFVICTVFTHYIYIQHLKTVFVHLWIQCNIIYVDCLYEFYNKWSTLLTVGRKIQLCVFFSVLLPVTVLITSWLCRIVTRKVHNQFYFCIVLLGNHNS